MGHLQQLETEIFKHKALVETFYRRRNA